MKPMDGDLNGYFSGRSTLTFQTPPSYEAVNEWSDRAETRKDQEQHLALVLTILTSFGSIEFDTKLVKSAQNGHLVLGLDPGERGCVSNGQDGRDGRTGRLAVSRGEAPFN